MTDSVNRRDVLKAAGATGSLVLAGTVQATNTGYGPVRLVEVGLEYDLPDGHSYHGTNIDGHPGYVVDERERRVVLPPNRPDTTDATFAGADAVVGTDAVRSAPVRVTSPDPTPTLTTGVVDHRRPIKNVHLVEPVVEPTVAVRDASDGLALLANGDRVRLEPGTERSLDLDPVTVVAETFHVTDEIVELPGVPDHRQGPRTDYDRVTVEAKPTVHVRDLGDLPVVEVERV